MNQAKEKWVPMLEPLRIQKWTMLRLLLTMARMNVGTPRPETQKLIKMDPSKSNAGEYR